jgi:uncharacterized sulfatase
MKNSRRTTLAALLLAAAMISLPGKSQAETYYVANQGTDTNDGRSESTAWQTVARVNKADLKPGDTVLFRRGDSWREQLLPHSGSPSGSVTYGAFGSGPKPLLLGSVQKNRQEDWIHESGNIWAAKGLSCDVGNIIFNGEKSCGVKVWEAADLKQQGQYWYDEKNRALKLYCVKSPAEHYSDIQCALRRHQILQDYRRYVIYENLSLKYGAAHGIGGANTHHIIVRDCDFCFIGGGDQMGGGKTVRFGNGVEFWGNAHDNLVERCRLWEIYDAALTNQNNGPHVRQENIVYRNNLIWNCEYSFEYWNRPESSLTRSIYFENNTCLNAGRGWGHPQRPDPSGRHLCFYHSNAPAENIVIRNNIFDEAVTNAFYAPGYGEDWLAALKLDHNCWFQSQGKMIRLKRGGYTMARFPQYQSDTGLDAKSMAAKPGLVDPDHGDFHLAAGSPCIDAGTDTSARTDFQGTPIPQGKSPDMGAYELANPSALAAVNRPNILFIYTDDQAPWTIGISGNEQARTPHIDRLFREGAYLTHCFSATPVCSPARVNAMASRYGTEVGITDWINPRAEPELGLDPSIVIWPELLSKAGYATGLVGKWHLGVPDRFSPNRNGFDYFMGFREGATVLVDPPLELNGQPHKVQGFTVNILTDHAIEFLRDHRKRPFALCVHYRSPHAPWLPLPNEDWEQFQDLDCKIPNPDYPKLDTPRVKRVMREYLGSVASVDRSVGRLLAALDELGLLDNTVVIYSSDQGYNMGHNGIWHKGNGHWILTEPPPGTDNVPKGQRPNMYDNSLLTPTGIRWPGHIAPGTIVAETTSNLDWYPTILAMVGVELPQGVVIRGHSFLPLLEGKKIPEWDNDIYAEYSMHHGAKTHMRMYRTPQWKLIRDFLNPQRDELYNLNSDPAETTNLIRDPSPQVQQVIAELHEKILAKMRQLKDPAIEFVK